MLRSSRRGRRAEGCRQPWRSARRRGRATGLGCDSAEPVWWWSGCWLHPLRVMRAAPPLGRLAGRTSTTGSPPRPVVRGVRCDGEERAMGAPTCGTATTGTPLGDGRVTYAAVVLVVGAVGDVLWGLAAVKDSRSWGGAYPLVESVLVGPLESWGWVVVVWSVVLAVGAALLFTSQESGLAVGVSAASLRGVAAGGRACVPVVRAGRSWGTPSPATACSSTGRRGWRGRAGSVAGGRPRVRGGLRER